MDTEATRRDGAYLAVAAPPMCPRARYPIYSQHRNPKSHRNRLYTATTEQKFKNQYVSVVEPYTTKTANINLIVSFVQSASFSLCTLTVMAVFGLAPPHTGVVC